MCVRGAERTAVQFLTGSNAVLRVWLNGRPVHQSGSARPFQPDAERFEAVLEKGPNRVFVQVSDPLTPAPLPPKGARGENAGPLAPASGARGRGEGGAEFHLRLRPKSSIAEQEQLAQAALTRPGNAERGRAVFLDAQKSQCLLCHRLGEQGERIRGAQTADSPFSPVRIRIDSSMGSTKTLPSPMEPVFAAPTMVEVTLSIR